MSKIYQSRRLGWGIVLLLLLFGALWGRQALWGKAAALYDNPRIAIVAVNQNSDLTIHGYDFPPNTDFIVTMGRMGSRGVGGSWVALLNSGTGNFTAVIPIPSTWHNSSQVAIRLENLWSGHYAYNWFYNNTAAVSAGNLPAQVAITPVAPASTPAAPPPAVSPPAGAGAGAAVPPAANPNAGYRGIPTCSFQAVVKDTSVTVTGHNFPKQMTFTVRLGTRGHQPNPGAGIAVATLNTGDNNTFTQTFAIPPEMVGRSQIGLRVESSAAANSYNCYNWFYNATTP
ncbi:MAG: hypothetical protein KJ063_06350 [Anaerolineae bacterium]|nr:hypothetical protein [Anaerolineae bacterium]